MSERKVVWFITAAVVSLAASLALTETAPSQYQLVVAGIAAIAQGLLAYRAFLKPPPVQK